VKENGTTRRFVGSHQPRLAHTCTNASLDYEINLFSLHCQREEEEEGEKKKSFVKSERKTADKTRHKVARKKM
jgi:hypothetical protein